MTRRSQVGRRAFLGAAAATTAGLLSGCSLLPAASTGTSRASVRQVGPQVDDVRGRFDWKRSAGTEVRLLLTAHNYTDALIADLADFEKLTGMTVHTTVVPEDTYFDQVSIELVSGSSDVDVFMLGAYMIWQYGPPGWLENLDPWLANRSATAADYDVDDLLPNLQDALRWSFVLGEPLGTGSRWALPWGWETNVIAYNTEVLKRLKVSPPTTLAELEQVSREAADLQRRTNGGYGLAVRGTKSWATVHPGFMTQFTREGNQDFSMDSGQLVPALATPKSIEFHRRWMSMVAEAGSPAWTDATYQVCCDHLASGRAALVYDATSVTVAKDRRDESPLAGKLAWHPGPAGPDGNLDSNLWVWSLAMSSRSVRKPAAWLFMQWATGRGHLGRAALNKHTDPVRLSIMKDPRYRASMARHRGYLETVDAVRDVTSVRFTPQPYFFDATTQWAGALQQIHAGADASTTLTALADRLRRHG